MCVCIIIHINYLHTYHTERMFGGFVFENAMTRPEEKSTHSKAKRAKIKRFFFPFEDFYPTLI